MASGRLLRTITYSLRGAGTVAFSFDGERLASGGTDRLVRVCDATTGKELKTLPFDVRRVRALAFSPNGEWLVAGGGDFFNSGLARAWKIAD